MKLTIKNAKLFLLITCVFCLSCQPKGGSLIPVLQNGTRITSFLGQKDIALQYDTENFSLKMLGGWEPLYGNVGFTLIARNRSSGKISINFDKIIPENSLNEKLKILLVEDGNKGNSTVESKIIEVNAGETKVYYVSVGEGINKYKDGVIYKGNEIWMTIPAIFEKNNSPQTTDYYFKFRYDDYQPDNESNINEDLID